MTSCSPPPALRLEKLVIENFKAFKGHFELSLNDGLNIVVGDNEAGKSTILEAINLALTGQIYGRHIKNELSQYLFNIDVVKEYCESLKSKTPSLPPSILIELYFSDYQLYRGSNNSSRQDKSGLFFSIEFDECYSSEYEQLCKSEEVKTLPIEYYTVVWKSFALEGVSPYTIPLKSSFINSSETRFSNGSDIYLSRIIKDSLEDVQRIGLAQCYRRMVDNFAAEDAVKSINDNITEQAEISSKSVKISAEISTANAWEKIISTYLNGIPFQQIGKGEQCIVKTNLALTHKRATCASLILLEEPENHLSHSKLSKLIDYIKGKCEGKQIIISTHSSFVANKLGIEDLILLNDQKTTSFKELTKDTYSFFSKLPGYDTLRLLLAEKAILVEGDCDELVIQKIYHNRYGKLPIEDGIDVISVGLSYKRFFEIAKKINKKVAAIRDNDGRISSIRSNDSNYLKENGGLQILFFDEVEYPYSGNLPDYNNNTLEPCILRANDLTKLNSILKTNHKSEDDLLQYMKNNKTDCALNFFETKEDFTSPKYIIEAIEFVHEQ